MSEYFLHGVEVLENSSGPRPVRTVATSVIGVVGDGQDDAAYAFVELGATNNKIRFFQVANDGLGSVGNTYSVTIIKPSSNNAVLSVSTVGKDVTISLATDGTATATTTVNQLIAFLNGSGGSAVNGFMQAAVGTSSTGSGLVAVHAKTNLAGGVDATFPLDRPVLINSPGASAKAGVNTYLGKALAAIYKQAGAVCVVVRTGEDGSMGDIGTLTGVYALKRAQSDLGVTPRIIVCEDAETAIEDVKAVCQSLRAIAFIGVNTADTAAEAAQFTLNEGNARTMTVWPPVNGGEDPAPYLAGAQARSDNDRGFWWSVSNQEVLGINFIDFPVDFQLGDATSLANILNEGNVTTFIRQGGFRIWGNRTGSTDPKWAFLCVRRTADVINDSVQRSHLWAVDRPIVKTYLDDVTESVNGYLRTLKNIGAILGGKCWPDPDLNSTANVPQGKVYFNFDFGPAYPAEHVTFQSILENDYVTDLV